MMNLARTIVGQNVSKCQLLTTSTRGFATSPVVTQNNPPNKYEKTLNQVILLGRVGNEPQMRGSQEHPVCLFSLATHSNYQYSNGELLQKTDWHRVCVFKPNLRETVYKYMTKGQRALVQGRISYGEVKDANGNAVQAVSIIADDVTFFAQGASVGKSTTQSAAEPQLHEVQQEDLNR